jgi:hypothetical protein
MATPKRYMTVEAPDTKAVVDFLGSHDTGKATIEMTLDGHTLEINVRDARDYNSLETFIVELSEKDEDEVEE